MRSLVLLCLLVPLFFACGERTEKEMALYLKNETSDTLIVRVSPKQAAPIGLYQASGLNGNYQKTIFNLNPGQEQQIYQSSEPGQLPEKLAGSVFQSITILANRTQQPVFYFSPDSIAGYTENPFSSNAYWNFELREHFRDTQFRSTTLESGSYTFILQTDKKQ